MRFELVDCNVNHKKISPPAKEESKELINERCQYSQKIKALIKEIEENPDISMEMLSREILNQFMNAERNHIFKVI